MDQPNPIPDGVSPGLWKQHMWQGAGFSQEQIDSETSSRSQDMINSGFSSQEVKEYWGQKDPDMTKVQAMAKQGIAEAMKPDVESKAKPKREPIDVSPRPIESKDTLDAMAAAYGNSIFQLGITHQESPIYVPDNASEKQKFANFAAGMLADSPIMFLSAALGGPLAAFGVPQGLRAAFVDSIRNGEMGDDWAQRVGHVAWETAKGALTGATAATAGALTDLAGVFATSPLGKALTGTTARYANELMAQVATTSALEKQLPKWQDFAYGSIMIGGLHALGKMPQGGDYISKKLQDIWVNTGAHPQEVIEATSNDAHLRGQILSENPNLPKDADRTDQAQEEPKQELPPIQEQKVNPGWELPDTERNEVLSRVGDNKAEQETPGGIRGWIKKVRDGANDEIGSLYYGNVDRTQLIKDVLKEAGKDPLDKDGGYLAMRLFAASNDTVDSFFKHGTRDFGSDEVNGEALIPILDEYKKESGDKNLNNLRSFMISDHSLSLQERGISQTGNRQNDAAIVAAGEKSGYRKYAKRIVDFENRVNRFFGDSGFWTEDQMDRMEENDTYIPMHKVVDADLLSTKSNGKLGFMKTIGDSQLQLIDPIESIRKNTEIKVKKALQNDVKNKFIDQMNGAEAPWFSPGESNEAAINESKKELDAAGLDSNTLLPLRSNPGKISPGQFDVWKDGKRSVINTTEDIADCINKMSGNYASLGTWTKLLRSSAYLLRFGVVENPLTGFPIRHTERNVQTALTLSKTNLAPADILRFAPEYLAGVFGKGSKDYANALYKGAFVNAGDKIPDGYYSDQIRGLEQKVPTIKKAWNLVDDNLLNFSRLMITHADNMSRFAEYKGLLKQGKSLSEAAYGAREVLPDVQKQGLNDSVLKNITAFLNVHIQGQARMAQALGEQWQDGKDVLSGAEPASKLLKGYIAKNLAYVTTTSLLLQAANSGDSVMEDLPDHQKWNYFNFHVPSWRPANQALAGSEEGPYPTAVRYDKSGNPWIDDGWRFKIQKPFTNGILFGSTPEVILDSIRKDDPALYGHFLKTVAGSVLFEPIPTGVAPVMSMMNNKDSYTGKPIARYSMENKLPEMDYDAYTSETSKRMAQLLSSKWVPRMGPDDALIQSPRVIEHLVKGYMGGTGKMLLQLSDYALGKAGILPTKPQMEKTINESIFMNSFMGRYPDTQSQAIDDFESKNKSLAQIQNSILIKRKEGDERGAVRLEQLYQGSSPKLQGIQDMINNHRHSQMAIISDSESTPTDKRQIFDILHYEMVGAAMDGLKTIKEIEKAGK